MKLLFYIVMLVVSNLFISVGAISREPLLPPVYADRDIQIIAKAFELQPGSEKTRIELKTKNVDWSGNVTLVVQQSGTNGEGIKSDQVYLAEYSEKYDENTVRGDIKVIKECGRSRNIINLRFKSERSIDAESTLQGLLSGISLLNCSSQIVWLPDVFGQRVFGQLMRKRSE